jgi:NitT/TauT family transport system substrate-binding protein
MISRARPAQHASWFWLLIVVLTVTIGSTACRQSQSPAVQRSITVARCVGYCNLSLFVAANRELKSVRELQVNLKYIANPGDHAIALASPGGPSASVTPFTNVAAGFVNDKRIRIIAGSGMNGLALLGRPQIKTLADLKGKKIGTFRADTLEIFAYDAVRSVGIEKSVRFIYFADALEPITALKNGEVDAITHVEPFVTNLVGKDKMNLLVRGESLWKTDHPDCVLVSTTSQINERRQDLKDLILQMLVAQRQIEENLPSVAERFALPFYQMSPGELVTAAREQFPQVDIRDKRDLILEKSMLLANLGYIRQPPGQELFDFSLLGEVISENRSLWESLKHRSPGQ